MRRLKVRLALALAACLPLIAGLIWAYALLQPLAATPHSFGVAPGASLNATLDALHSRGVLGHPRLLSYYARLAGRSEIRHGEYRIERGDTALDLLAKLHLGTHLRYPLRFIEGWPLAQAMQELARQPGIRRELESYSPEAIAAALGIQGHPEGWLHPNTYLYSSHSSDMEVLRQALQLQRRILAEAWAQRSGSAVLKTPYEALILASIIEKETAVDDERREIAGVFIRRLERNMRLQSDPTVIYGLGDAYDGDITRAHLRGDTPYNTYRIRGLPPTPICLPGEASIRAALNPAQGDTLYFVARSDGSGRHQFSRTLEEHERAVRAMLRR